ncbi:MAG TPA: hypothetical protein VFS97_13530 [Nitrososphaeraceae archaeon]|nr:hypothetical protein [Nitrososphaeraceae archaeon]
MSPTLKDTTTGETRRIHICYECDPDQYPKGKPIDPNDSMARPNTKGEWVCGDCQIEELNKRKIRVLGPDHKDIKWFIDMENRQVKAYNNYAKRVNENMGAGLKYRKNKYTGRILF